jgi:hypothetical protein
LVGQTTPKDQNHDLTLGAGLFVENVASGGKCVPGVDATDDVILIGCLVNPPWNATQG